MKNYLIIGLGSMGKRRVRGLKYWGVDSQNIIGMDRREDRCTEAKEKYGIRIALNKNEINFDEIEAVIVSLPPDKHYDGVKVAIEHDKPVFVEASVVLDDVKKIKESNVNDIFIAPSGTFIFHPVINEVRKIVKSGKYGKVCNFSYHSGQYLPDWHPWEKVNDFYVSNRVTGGAREIVPYELTWIVDVFGFPKAAKGYFRRTTDIGCDIEDSYVCSLDYGDMVGGLMVDVVGRSALRNLAINFEKAQLQWRGDREQLEIYEAETGGWRSIDVGEMVHEEGYDNIINENMYFDEIGAFLKGIMDRNQYPNTIEKDIKVLKILEEVENSDGGFDRGE
jgi:predicted dehydrogenase